jgi:hypothetical protein
MTNAEHIEAGGKMRVTVTNHTEYHHMPRHADCADCNGLTLRQAMRILRAEDYGDIGGTYDLDLSDGSSMSVELAHAYGGGQLTQSQRCVRTRYDAFAGRDVQIAVYPIVQA